MATYKVPQDIEAEDKLLGWLTLRQFVYAFIVVFSCGVMFKIATSGKPLLAIPFLPHTILFAVLASPFGHDQPSEVWLLAKIRYFLKPRRRIWDQNGLKELVTVTAPKKIEKILTDNLSQTEVKSRLKALAATIDSRGWAVQSMDNPVLFNQPAYVLNQTTTDRLIDPATLPREVPTYEVTADDDVLDDTNSRAGQNFDQLMINAEQNRRQQLMGQMQQAQATPTQAQPANWFMNPSTPQPQVSTTGLDEPAVAATLGAAKQTQSAAYGNMRTIDPGATSQPAPIPTPQPAAPTATSSASVNPAILELANNDDLNVATIARQADKAQRAQSGDEVVISLH